MELEFRLMPEDLVALARYHAAHPPTRRARSQRRALWWTLALVTLLCALAIPFDIRRGEVSFYTVFFAACWLALLILTVFKPVLLASAVKRSLREGNSAKLLGKRRLVMTPEGLVCATEWSTATISWTGIEKIAATENHAFLYQAQNQAIVVPKRVFSSEEDFLQFVETAYRYWEAPIASLAPKPREGVAGITEERTPRPPG
jgi:YcxB-like protein